MSTRGSGSTKRASESRVLLAPGVYRRSEREFDTVGPEILRALGAPVTPESSATLREILEAITECHHGIFRAADRRIEAGNSDTHSLPKENG